MRTAAITTVGQHDVLLGRDKAQHNHPGNKRFRALVHEFREEYQQSLLRESKKRIAQTVISIVNANGGRFLKQDDDDGHGSRWSEVSEIDQYKKVCHALRSAKASRSTTIMANSIDTSRQLLPNSLFSVTTSQEEQRRQEEVEESATHPRMPREMRNVEVESVPLQTADATVSAVPMAAAAALKGIPAAAPCVAAATLSAVPTVAVATSNREQDVSEQQHIIQICGCAGTCIDNVDIRTVFDDDDDDDDYNAISIDDHSLFREDDMKCVVGDFFE